MKAAIYERYGPPEVLGIRDVARPKPAENEVLVHVRASTVTRTDCGLRRAWPFFIRIFTGLFRPKQTIIGIEFAGEIVAVGSEVEELAPGDRARRQARSNAEYVSVKRAA
jgi:NADPH:quinone reductase-like Zn-dependent oxidoreductase